MKLHEIELYTKDAEAAKDVFGKVLNLKLNVDQPGLKVFDAGAEGVDLNISNHYENDRISLSFLVKDVDEYYKNLLQQNVEVTAPYDSHLGLRSIVLADNSVCRVVINSPTEQSPEWLRKMV